MSLFDLPQEEFEKAIDDLMKQPSGKKCQLCRCVITNGDEISYPDSPECCEEHGFISLCPNHSEWFWHYEIDIDKQCIIAFHLNRKVNSKAHTV